jgi:hypothetical protein
MGLLDDAIREHLELRRLKGADPGDVAREERDALGHMMEAAEVDEGAADREGRVEWVGDSEPSTASLTGPVEIGGPDGPLVGGAGQETVELDMGSVLDGASDRDPVEGDSREEKDTVAPVSHPRDAPAVDDSLEWEMPNERGEDGHDGGGSEERVEDVLEETPDFLRETPEQERLWFEQRPPRDFDFNE